MAINLIAEPFSVSPAFNELKFIYDSTNNNEPGFKYIFDIYEAGTANKIAERKVLPEFGTGYGELDVSKLLQGFVGCTFDPTNQTYLDATDSYYRYDVKIGEEFVDSVDYTSNLTDNGGNVRITVTHAFQVGDQIVITQDDGGAANPNLEGLFTVIAINGTTDFTVNSLFADVTDVTIDGTVKYADNRKTITRDIRTSLGNLVFNGAFTFLDWITYAPTRYDLDDVKDEALTTLPFESWLYPSQDIWVNIFNNTTNTFYLYLENDGGDIFRKLIASTGYVTQILTAGDDILVGASLVSGSSPLIKDDTEYYDFWIDTGVPAQVSVKYRFNIDRKCKIEDVQVSFKDRLGSALSMMFPLKRQTTGTIKREKYNKKIEGSVTSTRWGYSSEERGMTNVNIRQDETLVLRTNYIRTQEELDLFKELLTSPDVFVKIDGTYQAATIEDTSYEIPRLVNKRLNLKEIRLKIANQDVING